MKKSLMAALAAATLVLSGCAAADEEVAPEMEETVEETVEETEAVEEEVEPAPEPEVGDIVAVATEAGSFTTLVAVFAPTDEAFAALPEGVLDALLLDENLEVLQQILTYHVVAGEVLAADVTTGDVATVEGSTIAIEVGDQVTLNGTATVVTTDVEASNGVIHVIDQVILPEGVDPATLVE